MGDEGNVRQRSSVYVSITRVTIHRWNKRVFDNANVLTSSDNRGSIWLRHLKIAVVIREETVKADTGTPYKSQCRTLPYSDSAVRALTVHDTASQCDDFPISQTPPSKPMAANLRWLWWGCGPDTQTRAEGREVGRGMRCGGAIACQCERW